MADEDDLDRDRYGASDDLDAEDDLDQEQADPDDDGMGMSKHERQQLRMQKRIAQLEAQNMAEKDWFMQGESAAGEPACLISSQPVMLVCLTERHGLSIWMLLPNPSLY